jgi:hypothetical protein
MRFLVLNKFRDYMLFCVCPSLIYAFSMLGLLFLLGYERVLASLQMHAVATVPCVFMLIVLHMFACVYV